MFFLRLSITYKKKTSSQPAIFYTGCIKKVLYKLYSTYIPWSVAQRFERYPNECIKFGTHCICYIG